MAGIVEIFPRAPSGLTDAAVTNTVVDVKASELGGWLVGGNAYNPHATIVAFLQFFDLAEGDVILGTTEPIFSVAVPPVTSVVFDPPRPIRCLEGLSYVATATLLGSDAPSTALSMYLQFA